MILRNLLEQQTHRLVLRRRLPKPFSETRLYVSSEGGLRYLGSSLDGVAPELMQLVSEFVQPGSVVWDIGANLGLFTFAAAVAAGTQGSVLAVEPDPWLVNLLHRSHGLGRNPPKATVDVLCAAVTDRLGVAVFNVARRSRATNYLADHGTTQTGGSRHRRLVTTVTLDALLEHAPSPDVLKIDVEAAEVLVLRGGPTVLRTCPVVVCEVAQNNSAQVERILRGSGYQFYDARLPSHLRRVLNSPPEELLALRG